jgi:hypothetical protein
VAHFGLIILNLVTNEPMSSANFFMYNWVISALGDLSIALEWPVQDRLLLSNWYTNGLNITQSRGIWVF